MPRTKIAGKYIHHHDDFVGRHISENKEYYEKDFLDFSKKRLQWKEGVIIDVWANVGNHTQYRLRHWFSVMAFEPSEDNFELLKKNVKSYEDYVLSPTALSNTIKNYTMDINKWNRWWDKVVKSDDENEKQTALLDNIGLVFQNNVLLIKVDVEGMEKKVLQWAYLVIQRYLPDLLVEINDPKTAAYIHSLGYEKKWWRNKNSNIYFVHKTNV